MAFRDGAPSHFQLCGEKRLRRPRTERGCVPDTGLAPYFSLPCPVTSSVADDGNGTWKGLTRSGQLSGQPLSMVGHVVGPYCMI